MLTTPILLAAALVQQLAVHGDTVYTMAGETVHDSVVLIENGKILSVLPAQGAALPEGTEVVRATVVTPGLIDAHSVVGLAGWLNGAHDQDQLESSEPIQPELRAYDAYNPREPLVDWLRGFGVTTLHTGHAPRAVISGTSLIVKTHGDTVEDAVIRKEAMVTASLGDYAVNSERGKSPGNRAKAVALLRAELIRAQEYLDGRGAAEDDGEKSPSRDLRLETLGRVLSKELPLLVTVHRSQDIVTALRLAEEFDLPLVLDGAAEAYLLVDRIRDAGVPVLLHPTMARPRGAAENLSMETAGQLWVEGIPFALQSGYESYVPKTRVVLFEAAIAARYGLPYEAALASVTIDAARILGIDDRVGSLEPGKDADLALFDGDPFEYTSHVTGVVIDGRYLAQEPR